MVIENDHLHSEFAGSLDGHMVLAATVDGDEQLGSSRGQVVDASHAETVSLSAQWQANGDWLRPLAGGTQRQRQQRRRSHSIGVVVAEDADGLVASQCAGDPLDCLTHPW